MLKVTQELTKAEVLDWQHAGSLTQDLLTLAIAILLSYELTCALGCASWSATALFSQCWEGEIQGEKLF